MVKFTPRSLYPWKNPQSQRCWRREKSFDPTGIRVRDLSARSQVALPTVPASRDGSTLFLFKVLNKIIRSEWESHARNMNHLLAGRMGQRWRAEDIASLWFPFVTNKSFAFRKKSKSLCSWQICSLVSRVLFNRQFDHRIQNHLGASVVTGGPVCLVATVLVFFSVHMENTRVGTLIVATIYLQLIQNRYMFRSFTVLQCSHQHCVQPVASDVEVVGYLQQRLLCW